MAATWEPTPLHQHRVERLTDIDGTRIDVDTQHEVIEGVPCNFVVITVDRETAVYLDASKFEDFGYALRKAGEVFSPAPNEP